jgi:hypothetical protein
MDISADGATLVVANNYNDSISVIDTTRLVATNDLRQVLRTTRVAMAAGGTFPFAVVVKGNGTAYLVGPRS